MKINEIFHSIQGEGSRAGKPCVFVRLHGCGLRCTWCDTPYALDHRLGGEPMAADEILARIARYKCDFVELTGGEPLEQTGVLELMTMLCDRQYSVALETGGHIDISTVDPRVTIILDIKCPASGMVKRNRLENLEYLKPSDEVKFVIAGREDYEWMRATLEKTNLRRYCREVLLSPAFGILHPRDLASWILEDALDTRMQLQMHKYIWDPDTRGV